MAEEALENLAPKDGLDDINPSLQKALDTGWTPKEEWEGDPEDWVDYREFNHRGELMDRIRAQSSQLKTFEKKLTNSEKTLQELAEHHRKVREIEYKNALQDLKDMKKEAFESGDYDRVVDIDEKMDELKEMSKKDSQQSQSTEQNQHQTPQVVEEWISENPWYVEDRVLRGAADALADGFVQDNPELQNDIPALLVKVKKELEKEFPNKFGKPRNRSSILESNEADVQHKANKSSKRKGSARLLNEDQRRVAKRFLDTGAIASLDEYAQQLIDLGEL